MDIQSQSNERLEYLGDSILSSVIAEYLFKKYPDSNEGFLTKMRAKVVKRKTLNAVAKSMALDTHLSNFNNIAVSKSMLGNALEALIGAIYLENGYYQTKKYIIEKILMVYIDVDKLEAYDDNFKSQLLEWCQKYNNTVSYALVNKSKKNNRDHFTIAVKVNGEKLATAQDYNKKSAEQKASRLALKHLDILKSKNLSKPPVI